MVTACSVNSKILNTTKTTKHVIPDNFIICPIAIAYSMGQIIKSVCVCQSVYLSVRLRALLTVAFLDRFSPKLAQTSEPPNGRTSSLAANIALPLPLFCPPKPPFK